MSGQSRYLSLEQRIFHIETKQQIQKISTPEEIANRRIYNLKIAFEQFRKQTQEEQNNLKKQKEISKQTKKQILQPDNKQKMILQNSIKVIPQSNNQMIIEKSTILPKNDIIKESIFKVFDGKNNKKQQYHNNNPIKNNNIPFKLFAQKNQIQKLKTVNNKPELNIFTKNIIDAKSTISIAQKPVSNMNKIQKTQELNLVNTEAKNIFNIQKQEKNNQPLFNPQKPLIISFLNKSKETPQQIIKQQQIKQTQSVQPKIIPIKSVQQVEQNIFEQKIVNNTIKQKIPQQKSEFIPPAKLFSAPLNSIVFPKQQKIIIKQQKPVELNNIFKDTKLQIKVAQKPSQIPQNQKNTLFNNSNPTNLFNVNTSSIPSNFLSKPITINTTSSSKQHQEKNKFDLFTQKDNNLFNSSNNSNLIGNKNLFTNTANTPNLFGNNNNSLSNNPSTLFGNNNKTLFSTNNQSNNPFDNTKNPFSSSNNPFGNNSLTSNPFGNNNTSFLNKPKEEENEGSQEGDQEQKTPPSPEINPLNSTGNYEYQKSSEVLFKGQANHFRRNNNSDVIRNIYITIQKFDSKYNLLIRSVQTKTIRYQGLIMKNSTFQYMNANKANIKADKLISIDESTKKPIADMLRIQFKDQNISGQILKKISELKFD